jgi:hypothetical protein
MREYVYVNIYTANLKVKAVEDRYLHMDMYDLAQAGYLLLGEL